MLTVALRYYTISMILGTVALAYGSVPLYKMVSGPRNFA
jgi:cytochrome c oxidase assembly protein Cox11